MLKFLFAVLCCLAGPLGFAQVKNYVEDAGVEREYLASYDSLIAATGLANATEGRFAAVSVLSYASTVAPKVHVIGDASATTQPKAGHIANQEAKVCADAIVRLLAGGQPDPAPVTNSACFSTITMSQASWLTAGFQYDATKGVMVPVAAAGGASPGWSGDHFNQMGKWFNALMADTFA